MRNLLQNLRLGLNRVRETLFKSLFRARFRYDVFISYSHRDAKDYAVNLKKQLGSLDFACFIDEEESPPGLSLGPTLEKALKKSAVLVLLATERALTRPYVALEFESFAPTKRRIIPINISGALTSNDERALSQAPWNLISERKLIWIDESAEAFAKQNPSPPIADGIDKLFKYTRRNVRVRTEIIGTAALVLLAAFGAGFVIKGQAAEVSKQATLAEVARKETTKQQAIATEAGNEAKRQLEIARLAGEEAKRQGLLAETAKKEAEHQQEIAKVATAEADKQQKLAREATLEADRQLERGRHLLYDSDMNLAQSAYDANDMTQVSQLLQAHLPTSTASDQADLRGFDWFYLWRLNNNEEKRLQGYAGPMAFSPNSRELAIGASDKTLKLRDTTTQEERVLPGFTGPLYALMFSPDSRLLITDGRDGEVKLWDLSANPPKDLRVVRAAAPKRQRSGSGHGSTSRPAGIADIPLAFSRDGKTLASWNKDTVNLWDTTAWKDQGTLKLDLSSVINSVSFSPNGKILIIDNDQLIEFWDLSGSVPKELEMLRVKHHNVANIVVFSPDSKTLVTEDQENAVKLWDVSTGTPKERAQLEKSRWHLFGAFAPNGGRLVLVDYSGLVEVWDTNTEAPGQAKLLTVDLGKDVNMYPGVAISSDGNTVALWKGNGIIKVLSVEVNEVGQLKGEFAPFNIPDGVVDSVEFSPDGKTLAALCSSGIMKVWDLGNGQELGTLKAQSSAISNLEFSPDGTTLAALSSDETLKLWDMNFTRLSPVTYPVDFYLLCATFSPNGKTLAIGGSDGARLLDTDSVKDTTLLKKVPGDHVHALAFSPDGKMLVIGGSSGMELWNSNQPTQGPKQLSVTKRPVTSVTFSQDGKMLVAIDMEGNVELWETGKLEKPKLRKENTSIRMAVFSRDHKMLVTVSQDGNLRLLDTEALKERKILSSSIETVALSPGGNTMITVSQSGQVKLWDTERLEEQKTMDLQLSDVGAVALSSDGKILAIGSGRIVKLRDAITGQGLATLTARGDWNASPIVSLTFSPDGKMLVASNAKGVTLWYAATNNQMTALQGKH